MGSDHATWPVAVSEWGQASTNLPRADGKGLLMQSDGSQLLFQDQEI